MNLFLTKNLAHYNTDCLYEFYVYRIDVYDFSMYGFFKGGILFITFLFKNSKKEQKRTLALHGSKYRYPLSYYFY